MIEELLLRVLQGFPEITSKLATYAGNPAIFFQLAPHDQDEAWEGAQYPRIVYSVDWQFSPERDSAGTLAIDVFCFNDFNMVQPKTIGSMLKSALQDLFLTAENTTYAIAWKSMKLFEAESGKNPEIYGVTLCFDILALPVQYTTAPDPIESLSLWLKANVPTGLIIGVDTFPEAVWATSDAPIIYTALQTDSSVMRNSYSVAWLKAAMTVHVFSPDTARRQFLCRNIVNALSIEGEILLTDKSQMLIKSTAITTGNTPLQQGQIAITGEYGVLRQENPAAVLNHAYFERRNDLNDN